MQIGLVFIIVALVVSFWQGFIGPRQAKEGPEQTDISKVQEVAGTQKQYLSQSTQPAGQKSAKTQTPSPTKSAGILVDTDIQFGPLENEAITETNKVLFAFGATVSPKTEGEKIIFETKVEGLETAWQETDSTQRTIEFPAGPKQYTFLVRAKYKNIVDQTPAARIFKINISPYFGKVKFSQVRLPTNINSSLITLNTFLGAKETADITGWAVKGKYGKAVMPQGIETYDPLATTLASQDIIIKQNDTIYISPEPNPLGGNNWNFRLNKCMGYLTDSHKFPIEIYKNCPTPDLARLPPYLSTDCRDLIASLRTCEQSKYEKLVEYDVLKDSNCLYYLNATFNYTGCFANYFQKTDFTQNQWHIYLNRIDKEVMDYVTDTVYLLDKNGLLVDKYSYGSRR